MEKTSWRQDLEILAARQALVFHRVGRPAIRPAVRNRRSGQTMVEYILLVSVIIVGFMVLKSTLLAPMESIVGTYSGDMGSKAATGGRSLANYYDPNGSPAAQIKAK